MPLLTQQSRLVDDLVARVDGLRGAGATSKTQVVALTGAIGTGKTTVVRGLYARLAEGQAVDKKYWPQDIESGRDASRKVIWPHEFDVPKGVTLPYLWLGIEGRPSSGVLGCDLIGLEDQIKTHLAGILKLLEARKMQRDLLKNAAESLAGLVPLPDVIGLAIQGVSGLRLAMALLRARRDARREQGRSRSGQRFRTLHRPIDGASATVIRAPIALGRGRGDALAGFAVNVLAAAAVPVIIAADEADNLDKEELGFLQKIYAADLPVLIVTTSLPPNSSNAPFSLWLEAIDVSPVELSGSTVEDLEELARTVVPDLSRQPRYARQIAAAARGNPLLLTSILESRALRETIAKQGDIDQALRFTPPTAAGLIRNQFDNCARDDVILLEAAALQGFRFTIDLLAASIPADSPPDPADIRGRLISDRLAPLVRSPEPIGRPDRQWYEFVENEAYELGHQSRFLTGPERTDCIRRLRAASRVLRGNPDEDLSLHAHAVLFRHGDGLARDERNDAIESALRLAEAAESQGSREDALPILEQAAEWLEQAGRPSEAITTQARGVKIMRLLERIGDSERRGQDCLAAAEAANAANEIETAVLARARRELAMTLRRTRDPAKRLEAAQLGTQCVAELGSIADVSLQADIRELQMLLAFDAGDRDASRQLGVELLEYCEEHLGPEHQTTQDVLQFVAFRFAEGKDKQDKAKTLALRTIYLEREIERRGNNDRHPQLAAPLADLASSLADTGDLTGALERIERAISLRERSLLNPNVRTLRLRSKRMDFLRLHALHLQESEQSALLDEALNEGVEISVGFSTLAAQGIGNGREASFHSSRLAGVYLALEQWGDAAQCARAAISGFRSLNPSSPSRADVLPPARRLYRALSGLGTRASSQEAEDLIGQYGHSVEKPAR